MRRFGDEARRLARGVRDGNRTPGDRSHARRTPVRLPEPEEREVYRILNFALRAGAIMLSSGAGTLDVESTILDLSRACGLESCEVDVTFTSLTASYIRAEDVEPITTLRVVRRRSVDYGRLARIHALRLDLTSGLTAPEEAFAEIDSIASSTPAHERMIPFSWAAMAAAFTVLLGGAAFVAAVAFTSTIVVYLVNRVLSRQGIPEFFLSAFGAAMATTFATILFAVKVHVLASLVVAGGIMVLVPGYALVASVQDALTGFPISGSARGLEVLLTATGIVSGVAISLYVSKIVGVEPDLGSVSLTTFVRVPVQVAAAGIAAALYATSTAVPRRSLVLAGATGASGWACLLLLLHGAVPLILSTSIAAVLIGVMSNAMAIRQRTHPFLFIVPGVMPLVPGLTIYNGMLELFTGHGSGSATLLRAVGLGLAIAAGVTLGSMMVRSLARAARGHAELR